MSYISRLFVLCCVTAFSVVKAIAFTPQAQNFPDGTLTLGYMGHEFTDNVIIYTGKLIDFKFVLTSGAIKPNEPGKAVLMRGYNSSTQKAVRECEFTEYFPQINFSFVSSYQIPAPGNYVYFAALPTGDVTFYSNTIHVQVLPPAQFTEQHNATWHMGATPPNDFPNDGIIKTDVTAQFPISVYTENPPIFREYQGMQTITIFSKSGTELTNSTPPTITWRGCHQVGSRYMYQTTEAMNNDPQRMNAVSIVYDDYNTYNEIPLDFKAYYGDITDFLAQTHIAVVTP